MSVLLLNANALHIPLADKSVQCVVTSPPYFGLRNYGVDGQIGLEETPAAYVETMVQVFREVWRVMRDDGTLWLNLGDSYAGSGGAHTADHANPGLSRSAERNGVPHYSPDDGRGMDKTGEGLKAKDLVGIPWRVAFALQADGWYLRSDIIWSKLNPMPESVQDRPTKSHEYIFLLAKQERYYYDAEAVKEPSTEVNWESRYDRAEAGQKSYPTEKVNGIRTRSAYSFARKVNEEPPPGEPNQHRADREDKEYSGTRNRRSVWTIATSPYAGAHFATYPPALVEPCIKAGSRPGDIVLDPFNGSGTTGAVAVKLGRSYVGIELKPEYIELSRRRLADVQPFLVQETI